MVLARPCHLDARTCANENLAIVLLKWDCNLSLYPLGQFVRSIHRMHLRQQNYKFISAQPRHKVALPNHLLQAARHLLQNFVPDSMTMNIIDLLEVVQIDHQESEGHSTRTSLLQSRFKLVTVFKSSQRIVMGKVPQFSPSANLVLNQLVLGSNRRAVSKGGHQ